MDKITISNNRLLDLFQGLEAVKDLKGAKFGYAVSRTLRSIDPLVKALQDAAAFKPDYLEFIQAREDLGFPLAMVSESGEPLYDLYQGELFLQIIPERVGEFLPKYAALEKKYAKAIKAKQSDKKEYDEILKQEVTIEVFSIEMDMLPEGISLGHAFRILPMLTPRPFDSSIPCSYRNDLLLNFPSMVLRNFAGVTNRDFILGMLDNFRIMYDAFLELGRSRITNDYNNLYDQGRIALCEKYAEKNQYGNPKMIEVRGGLEYLIPESSEYSKAMRIFNGSMKEVISQYEALLKGKSSLHLSPISFDQLPVDFSGTQVDLLADLIRE